VIESQRRRWLWGWLGRHGYRAHRLVTTLAIAAYTGLVREPT
jgi:hypothetical protein